MAPQPPPDLNLAELVELDIANGFESIFPAIGGFSIAEPFAGTDEVSNDRLGVVAWEWDGQDTLGFNGLFPTDKPVTVRGVTVVEQRGAEGPLFHRYIDWIGVVGQLGLAFVGRPSIAALGDN